MEERKCLYKNHNHLANLNSMRLTGLFCDVTIMVNDTEIRAHKNILAANLKYFQSKFQEDQSSVIYMINVVKTDLEAFISFAYTGEILVTNSNALGLLKVANYLNEDTIKQTCIEFLEHNLKEKDACEAYQFANDIASTSLKNAAKSRILSNFKNCSQTAEYLGFDLENLKNILSDVDLTSDSQQIFFEGIMRWILHDPKNRPLHIKSLLNLIDMTKLAAGYVIEYLSENLKTKSCMSKEIMHLYHEKMQELKSLMIIGLSENKLRLQFYDYKEKKWCRLCETMDWNQRDIHGTWTISNNKFYYTVTKVNTSKKDWKTHLEVFNLSDKKNTTLTSDSQLLSRSALCACSRFLYLCGGCTEDYSHSDQVLRYDSQTSSLETLPPMKAKRSSAVAIFYQGHLLVLGGCDEDDYLNSVEKYDPATKEWTTFPPMCEERCRHSVAVLDGKLYACGGDNVSEKTVEVFDPAKNSWHPVASMNEQRYIFLLVALEGKLLAIGGDEKKSVEVYDPNKDQWQVDRKMSSELQKGSLLGGGLIPSSYANRHFM